MTATHWLNARVRRVEEERQLRELRARQQGHLFDRLLRVQEAAVERARSVEAAMLARMEEEGGPFDIGGGFSIQRRTA